MASLFNNNQNEYPPLSSYSVKKKDNNINDIKCWDGKNEKILSEEIINKPQPQEQIKKKTQIFVKKNKIKNYDDDDYDDYDYDYINENIDFDENIDFHENN